jgi:hypothetical protein
MAWDEETRKKRRKFKAHTGTRFSGDLSMRARPLTLKQANSLISKLHRHHKPVQGHRFSVGAEKHGNLIGAVVVGRPVSRGCDPYGTAEVTRLVTDGTKNACTFLYATAARICRDMGFDKIQTYILNSESGHSLMCAGWILDGVTAGGDWNHSKRYAGKRRTDQPMVLKQRWVKILHRLREE